MPPQPPEPRTAFLSLEPLEPVLCFKNEKDAKYYQDYFNSMGRIYPEQADCVYLPMPPGLVSVRTARRGDVAFVFKTSSEAQAFDRTVRVGRIYHSDLPMKMGRNRTVYLGIELI
jgi:hypothetical protein